MKPWTDIELPETRSAYNARLADPEHPLDFYWGRNINGQYVFRYMGNFPPELCEGAPAMRGIEVTAGSEGDRSHLTLVLESQEDGKIFRFLCNSLLEATRRAEAENGPAAARMILTHLTRWQKLLHDRGSEFLSLEKQIGLFGELLVLRDIFLANIPAREAVTSWSGPLGDEQDFGYGGNLVEVKTTRTTRDQEIRIASVDQLDSVSGDISLAFQTVGVFRDQPPRSTSLNELVSLINNDLANADTDIAEAFGMRLALLGYELHPEYDKYHFALVSRRIFGVWGDFPRICAKDLRAGIRKTSYAIQVDACIPYELDDETALGRILEGVQGAEVAPVDVPVELLLKLDESAELEFKSTLRICLKSGKPEQYIEHAILKSISAFANTSGGTLVIGVADNNEIRGLQTDYDGLQRGDRDGFGQCLATMLINNFGEAFASNLAGFHFHSVAGRDICIVTVKRSSELHFLEHIDRSGNKTSKLYTRVGNTTREIPPELIPDYLAGRTA